MSLSQAQIVNAALATLGAQTGWTAGDASPAGQAIAQLYEPLVRRLLALAPWSFASKTAQLAAVLDPLMPDGDTIEGWQYAYALPDDALGLPRRYVTGNRSPNLPEKSLEIQGLMVLSNITPLFCTYSFRAPEMTWPDNFTWAVIKALAAELCQPISGFAQQAMAFSAIAYGTPDELGRGGAVGEALREDTRNQPSKRLLRNPLLDARWS